jgi:hypothetical protein
MPEAEETRTGRFARERAAHVTAARRAFTRARSLIDELLTNWDPRDPARIRTAARDITAAAREGRVQADAYAAGFGLTPPPGTIAEAGTGTVDYAGLGTIAPLLGYKDASDLQTAMRRHPGWPEPDGRILPGRHGPSRGWLLSSLPAWEAWNPRGGPDA